MLDMYKKLFAVEAYAAENNFSAENRLQLRLEKSKPIINEMKLWLDKAVLEVPPKKTLSEKP